MFQRLTSTRRRTSWAAESSKRCLAVGKVRSSACRLDCKPVHWDWCVDFSVRVDHYLHQSVGSPADQLEEVDKLDVQESFDALGQPMNVDSLENIIMGKINTAVGKGNSKKIYILNDFL